MEYLPTTTDKEKDVILEDKDFAFYNLLKEILNQLRRLNLE